MHGKREVHIQHLTTNVYIKRSRNPFKYVIQDYTYSMSNISISKLDEPSINQNSFNF